MTSLSVGIARKTIAHLPSEQGFPALQVLEDNAARPNIADEVSINPFAVQVATRQRMAATSGQGLLFLKINANVRHQVHTSLSRWILQPNTSSGR